MSTSKQRATNNQLRDAEPAIPWLRRLIWVGVAVIGLGLIVLLAVAVASEEFLTGVPEGTEQVDIASWQHVDGEIYDDQEVPAGGEHSTIWQNCGFYSQSIKAENALHSLEHGGVWITYSPTLAQEDVDILRGFTGRAGKVLVSPVDEQESPVVLTAWEHQLPLHDVTDSRLEQFVNEFRTSPVSPEPGGRCDGGVGTPDF